MSLLGLSRSLHGTRLNLKSKLIPNCHSLDCKRYYWLYPSQTTPQLPKLHDNIVGDGLTSGSINTGVDNISIGTNLVKNSKIQEAPALLSNLDQNKNLLIDSDVNDFVNTVQLQSIQSIGDFKLLGLNSYWPSGWMQSIMEAVYCYSHLPWWGTIILATGLVRLSLFFFAVKSQKGILQLTAIKPMLLPLQEQMKKAKKLNDLHALQASSIKIQALFKEHKVNPLSGFLGFVQIPFFMGFFFGLKEMANLPVPGLDVGGIGWITDLTAHDPYLILPLVSSFGILLAFELNSEASKSQSAVMKNGIRMLAFISIPFFYTLPAAVFVYMASSSIMTLIQIMVLKNRAVRKYFGIPSPDPSLVLRDTGMLKVRPLSLKEAKAYLNPVISK